MTAVCVKTASKADNGRQHITDNRQQITAACATESDDMKLTVLGTGDTVGTPKIGCDCEVCKAALARGLERLRSTYLIEVEGHHILIDTSPDLRKQLLLAGSPKIDAVLWTHAHYDHIAGYNEFYRIQKYPPGYAAKGVMDDVAKYFHFVDFKKYPQTPYVPFELFGIRFTFVEVNHPGMYTCGVIIEYNGRKIGITSDTNDILSDRTVAAFENCDIMFIDALMNPTIHIGKHMNYAEAIAFADRVKPKEFHLVHMSHNIPLDWKYVCHDGFSVEI